MLSSKKLLSVSDFSEKKFDWKKDLEAFAARSRLEKNREDGEVTVCSGVLGMSFFGISESVLEFGKKPSGVSSEKPLGALGAALTGSGVAVSWTT